MFYNKTRPSFSKTTNTWISSQKSESLPMQVLKVDVNWISVSVSVLAESSILL